MRDVIACYASVLNEQKYRFIFNALFFNFFFLNVVASEVSFDEFLAFSCCGVTMLFYTLFVEVLIYITLHNYSLNLLISTDVIGLTLIDDAVFKRLIN